MKEGMHFHCTACSAVSTKLQLWDIILEIKLLWIRTWIIIFYVFATIIFKQPILPVSNYQRIWALKKRSMKTTYLLRIFPGSCRFPVTSWKCFCFLSSNLENDFFMTRGQNMLKFWNVTVIALVLVFLTFFSL